MPTVKYIAASKSGVKIFVEGQNEPLINQPVHPDGRAWRSKEEAIEWSHAFAEKAYGFSPVVEEAAIEEAPVEGAPVEEAPVEEETSA